MQRAPAPRNAFATPIVSLRNATTRAIAFTVSGFSRGAFAIRSLAGFIDLAGMPKQPRALKEEEVLEIYDAYMDGKLVDKARYGTIDTMIDFIGVWDTVGALAFGRTLGNFHRINPGNVKRVAHALARRRRTATF